MNHPEHGVLLMNLGTPAAPRRRELARFLAAFLTDPRVIDLPRWYWLPLLYGVILPRRSRRVAKAYAAIWTPQGSPLEFYTRSLAAALEAEFGGSIPVRHAMTYGEPSPASVLEEFADLGVQSISVLPLYPQYSSTTSAAALDALFRALGRRVNLPGLRILRSYPTHGLYISALADSVRAAGFEPDECHLLLSFHGIPARYSRDGDPYLSECQATARALAAELGLDKRQWTMSFQSRFGKEVWLQPYTEATLRNLADRGIRKLLVACPGFAVDCLETLEEIAVENKRLFLAAGGTDYRYVACLNDSPAHVRLLRELVEGPDATAESSQSRAGRVQQTVHSGPEATRGLDGWTGNSD